MAFEPSFNELVRRLTVFDQVEAVLLSGSSVTAASDEHSDYDLYVYLNAPLDADERKAEFDGLFSVMEYNNMFWETEDDGVLREGRPVEILYRDLGWMESVLASRLELYRADTGYTTCFWANFMSSQILFDRSGAAAALMGRFSVPYPEPLRRAIVEKNHPLLRAQIPAYYHQIEKALLRGDIVSVNHRIAAFVASYADILFALNRVPHPGEKRLLPLMEACPLRPDSLGSDLKALFLAGAQMNMDALSVLDRLVDSLDGLLFAEKLLAK
jgi:predicted nucleotidyltransferase